MVISDYQLHEENKWPLGPDIIEECQAVATLPQNEEDTWSPDFEPYDFNAAHGPLTIENYRLSRDALEEWAVRGIKIRTKIVEHSSQFAAQEEGSTLEQVKGRKLKGLKRSKPDHNIEGRTERDMKQ